jgi:hypothetical protein
VSDSPPTASSGAITALMLLCGIILLLPGLCAGFFVVASTIGSPGLAGQPVIILLWFVCFAITAGGIVLIGRAVRRLRA